MKMILKRLSESKKEILFQTLKNKLNYKNKIFNIIII
jgi:hypothetical protein